MLEKLPPKDQLIMGINALQEVLRYVPDHLLKIYTDLGSGALARKQGILADCEKKGIPIQTVSNELLTKMVGSDSHQSFVAHIKGRKFWDVAEYLQKINDQEKVFILMLDQIFDPQNFGAILRSAECFGVDGVIWSKNRGCDLTPMVAKASCGASELIDLLRISNLADSIEKFQKEGFEVVASLADPNAEPVTEFTYAPRTVLIVGSEGEGIQPLLCKKADRLIYIPLKGKIQSLNVAQASAVLLSKL